VAKLNLPHLLLIRRKAAAGVGKSRKVRPVRRLNAIAIASSIPLGFVA
jgi:hypothetical protein